MLKSDLFLKIRVLVIPELDASLSVERPSFDGLKALLMLGAPETMAIILRSGTSPFGRLILPGPL